MCFKGASVEETVHSFIYTLNKILEFIPLGCIVFNLIVVDVYVTKYVCFHSACMLGFGMSCIAQRNGHF